MAENNQAPLPHGRIPPTAEDWDRFRPIIAQQIYQKTNPMIVHDLEAAGYRVTVRMLQRRLALWNLRRNRRPEASSPPPPENPQPAPENPQLAPLNLEAAAPSPSQQQVFTTHVEHRDPRIALESPNDTPPIGAESSRKRKRGPAEDQPARTPRQLNTPADSDGQPGEVPRPPNTPDGDELEAELLNKIEGWYISELPEHVEAKARDGRRVVHILDEYRDAIRSAVADPDSAKSWEHLKHKAPERAQWAALAKDRRGRPKEQLTPMSFLNVLYHFVLCDKLRDDEKHPLLAEGLLRSVAEYLHRIAKQAPLLGPGHPLTLMFRRAHAGRISKRLCYRVLAIMSEHVQPKLTDRRQACANGGDGCRRNCEGCQKRREGKKSRAAILCRIGRLLQALGEWDAAVRRLQRAKDIAREIEDGHLIAVASWQLAIVEMERGSFPYRRADDFYEQALEALEKTGQAERETTISVLDGKAQLKEHKIGDLYSSEQLYARAIEIHENIGHSNARWKANLVRALNGIFEKREDEEKQRRLQQQHPEVFDAEANQGVPAPRADDPNLVERFA